ncbi:MAG: hypothetical protein NT092_00460 [Bacteroidia bacterium]|nr:hypothetical protein [Bacteroidia bacterium]
MSKSDLFIIVVCIFYPLNAACQTDKAENIKFRVQICNNNPLSGARILIKDSDPLIGTTTDMNGEAELIVRSDYTICVIDPVGPYIEFKLFRPADSVFLDVKAKKVIFYNNNKRIKKIKLNIATPFSKN